MLAATRRALLEGLLSLLVLSVVAFAILKAMPGDPVDLALRAWNVPVTPDTTAALRHAWALDQPLPVQYLAWLGRFLVGDWGKSFRTGEPVVSEFLARLPLTLEIGLVGLGIAMLLAVPLGFAAGSRLGGVADRSTRILSVAAQSIPVFWIGLILVWLLGVKLQWIRPFDTGPSALILPTLLIAFHSLGMLARVYRRDLLATPREIYFRTALAKGLGRTEALWRHGNAHALYALLSAVRSQAGWVIGGTATVEVLFGLPGISQFLVQSVASRDFFVLQAYVMVVAVWMVVMNALTLAALARIDPRTATS